MKSFVIMGCGRFGNTVATTLAELGNEVLVVDENYDKVRAISDEVTTAVQCDIMDEAEVADLGLKNFDVAVIAIGSNLEASVMGTLAAKEAGIDYIVAKATTLRQGNILEKLGAHKIIYPERDMAYRVAHNLTSKNILDYIQISSEFSMIETTVPRDWVNKSLAELDVRNSYGVSVVAIERDRDIIVSPYADEVLQEHDLVVILGSDERVREVERANA